MSTLTIEDKNVLLSEQHYYLVGRYDEDNFCTSVECKTMQEAYRMTNDLKDDYPKQQWTIIKRTVTRTVVAQTVV